MSMRYFGTGEYPYKTILKETTCESVAGNLNLLGYSSHVVHNNNAKFYSRNNAFAKMGFDSFVSKEFMNIQEYTPLGTWPTDDIMIDEVKKVMDKTEGSDFVYTITVQGHGAYPTEKVIENPEVVVSGSPTEEQNYSWEYYVNQIHEVDKFIKNLTEMLDERGEDTLVVLYGDHLPSMNLTEADMKTGSLFQTEYVTWNNFGMEKIDEDLASYQLVSEFLNRLNIHNGNINAYHQTAMAKGIQYGTSEYMNDLKMLQYDILYGDQLVYNGKNPYEVSDMKIGIDEVEIYSVMPEAGSDNTYIIRGNNFTSYSKAFFNGEKQSIPSTIRNKTRVPTLGSPTYSNQRRERNKRNTNQSIS